MARPVLTLTTPLTSATRPTPMPSMTAPTCTATNSSARTDPVSPALSRSACTRSMSLDGYSRDRLWRSPRLAGPNMRWTSGVCTRSMTGGPAVGIDLGVRAQRADEVEPVLRLVRTPGRGADTDQAHGHQRDAHQRNDVCRVHVISPLDLRP